MAQDRSSHVVPALTLVAEQLGQEVGRDHLAGILVDDHDCCALAQLEADRNIFEVPLQVGERRRILRVAKRSNTS